MTINQLMHITNELGDVKSSMGRIINKEGFRWGDSYLVEGHVISKMWDICCRLSHMLDSTKIKMIQEDEK